MFEEEKEGKSFESISVCPVCKQDKQAFVKEEEQQSQPKQSCGYRYMDVIGKMAKTGKPVIEAMRTQMPVPGFDELLVLGAQLNPPPLEEHVQVNIQTVIGKHAEKPLVLEDPVYISHMSFGALSIEAKTALSIGSAIAHTAMCSGEGGILQEEKAAAYRYIFEYVLRYSVTPENLREADAIEIKIGQGTKPGMGETLRS